MIEITEHKAFRARLPSTKNLRPFGAIVVGVGLVGLEIGRRLARFLQKNSSILVESKGGVPCHQSLILDDELLVALTL